MNQEQENEIKKWLKDEGHATEDNLNEIFEQFRGNMSDVSDLQDSKSIDVSKQNAKQTDFNADIHSNTKKLPDSATPNPLYKKYIDAIIDNTRELISKVRNK
jgi:hypothetical protein